MNPLAQFKISGQQGRLCPEGRKLFSLENFFGSAFTVYVLEWEPCGERKSCRDL